MALLERSKAILQPSSCFYVFFLYFCFSLYKNFISLHFLECFLLVLLKLNALYHVQSESLPGLVSAVYSDDNSLQLEGTTQFRKLLSIGNCVRRNASRRLICLSELDLLLLNHVYLMFSL
jgi:hypothetical protein